MSTEAKTTDMPTADERYHDARTLQGLAEAERGEGAPVEEVWARLEAHLDTLRK